MVTTFVEQIKILVELQKIDADIFRLKQELAACPELERKLEADFDKKRTHLKKAEEDLKALQLKQKEKEGDLSSREEKIKKLQGQLYQLKSNKEYSAMEMEIKGLKADKSVLEEEILRLLDSVDQAKAAVSKEKELLGGEEKIFRGELQNMKQRASEMTSVMNAQEEKRKSFTPNIEPRLLSQYERILSKREGVALVPVQHHSCGGCHLELPPQMLHEIQLQDKLMVCESCARILYWVP